MNLAVNPRDVAYCFVKYARLIHAKVSVKDPNFIRLSIACGKVRCHSFAVVVWDLADSAVSLCLQIEQWAEHHYPSFVNVGSSGGNVTSSIDTDSGDARAEIYTRIAEDERRRAAVRKQQEMYESMVERGIIKPQRNAEGQLVKPDFIKMREDGTLRNNANDEPVPWLFIASIIGGVFAVFAITGGLLVWVMLTYFNDSE